MLVLPRLAPVDLPFLRPAAAAMIVVNLLLWEVARRTRTANAQQAVGTIGNLVSTTAIVLVLWSRPEFVRHTGPALMVGAVFVFVLMGLRFVLAAPLAIVYLAIMLAPASGDPDALVDAFLVGASLLVAAMATWIIERGARERFAQAQLIVRQRAALAAEQAKSDRLLRNVLPDAVVERLRDAPGRIADAAPDATVLFADLVGFTPLAAGIAAADLVALLDELFSRFDDLADRHGVTKVKTIGDAYMAVGGVPGDAPDHPARVVALALDLVDAVAVFAHETGRPLAVRVGVHTGPLVAGVIGKRRIGWDLWGDTVNVASRLQSTAPPDTVHVSDVIRARLDGDARFSCTPREPLELKGLAPATTWLVSRPD